ncbi:MAG: primosomal protein N' [Chitinophagales bacterium]|nr:primosomal protein N' [Chitinophagales bacterium]
MNILFSYQFFAEVIVPLALPKTYTFAIPNHLENKLSVGQRVEVQFGRSKLYAGIIFNIHQNQPNDYVPKEILGTIDDDVIVEAKHLQFWQWIASYYMCSLGEVMEAALPAYFKISSQTFFLKNSNTTIDETTLNNDDAYLVMSAFEHQEELSYKDIQTIVQKKSIGKLIQYLINNKLIYIKEQLINKYSQKTAVFISLDDSIKNNSNSLKKVFDDLKNAPKQEQVLLALLSIDKKEPVLQKEVLEKANAKANTIKSLIDKKILQKHILPIDRVNVTQLEDDKQIQLSELQHQALLQIEAHWQSNATVLLHGITSSGKTLIYIELIKKIIVENKQCLFLLPEIALTAQLIQRLSHYLGDIAVYHSKLNDAERIEIWTKVLNNEIKIIVGARSALFLPFQNLALIIIDEEHDASYKQQQPNPKYHARDAALMLAKLQDAKVLLGSATPSIESYFNAKANKYGLVELQQRYGGVLPPNIEFVNLNRAKQQKAFASGLTFTLRDEVQNTLNSKNQIILFQNRRGFAPYIICNNCAWVPTCKNCDVTLTYHKYSNDLRCHYCGFTQTNLHECKACKSTEMQQVGLGTERIEEDVQIMFPKNSVGRMDYDTVRGKHGHEKIINQFQQGEFDILIGTQMVTKGLDFDKVQLVGILDADTLMHFPNFRAEERAYQLMIQAAGRAGRRDSVGKVIIQMSDLEHPIVDAVVDYNYNTIYQLIIKERQQYQYPPFSRLIQLSLKHKKLDVVENAAQYLYKLLQAPLKGMVLAPHRPIYQKINNYYIRDILIKIPRTTNQVQVLKQNIRTAINTIYQYQKFKQVQVIIDVDVY